MTRSGDEYIRGLRRPYAVGSTSVFDYPLSSRLDETDSLVVFGDVFVPWEDVFSSAAWT